MGVVTKSRIMVKLGMSTSKKSRIMRVSAESFLCIILVLIKLKS